MNGDDKAEFISLCRKVGFALLRLVFLAMFLAAHYGLNIALRLVLPSNMTKFVELAQIMIGVIFLLIYAYLAWDMVTVFMPRLKRPILQMARVSEPDENDELQD